VRETEHRAKLASQPRRGKPSKREVGAEERAALREVADRLESALGHEVTVRPKGEGIAVELHFDALDEASELASRFAR
ncbi:MAG TPA: chromosome partitioning protein ParB, partial [Solirubrobacterales bacterium]